MPRRPGRTEILMFPAESNLSPSHVAEALSAPGDPPVQISHQFPSSERGCSTGTHMAGRLTALEGPRPGERVMSGPTANSGLPLGGHVGFSFRSGQVIPDRQPQRAAGERGTRPAKRAPHSVPGKARPVGLVVCAEWQLRSGGWHRCRGGLGGGEHARRGCRGGDR